MGKVTTIFEYTAKCKGDRSIGMLERKKRLGPLPRDRPRFGAKRPMDPGGGPVYSKIVVTFPIAFC